MEHRLIQGGEQYLPFARSCVAKLKKLGLPYADQSYEVDGVSIKVRIEPGHEYIRIEGNDIKILSGVVREAGIVELPIPSGSPPGTAPGKTLRSYKPTQNAWDFPLRKNPGKSPEAFNDENFLAEAGEQYRKITPSMFSGLMAQAVAIVMGRGLEVKYDYMWARCHGITRSDDDKLWLVEISAENGVIAKLFPLAKGNKSSKTDAVKQASLLFGGVPAGGAFPSQEDLPAAITEGSVIRLATVADMAAYFGKTAFAPEMGWSFNSAGSAAHNTCWAHGAVDATQVFSYHYKLDISIGPVAVSPRAAGTPVAVGSAVLTEVETGELTNCPGGGAYLPNFIPFVFYDAAGQPQYPPAKRITEDGPAQLAMDAPLVVFFAGDVLEVIRVVYEDAELTERVIGVGPSDSYGMGSGTTLIQVGGIDGRVVKGTRIRMYRFRQETVRNYTAIGSNSGLTGFRADIDYHTLTGGFMFWTPFCRDSVSNSVDSYDSTPAVDYGVIDENRPTTTGYGVYYTTVPNPEISDADPRSDIPTAHVQLYGTVLDFVIPYLAPGKRPGYVATLWPDGTLSNYTDETNVTGGTWRYGWAGNTRMVCSMLGAEPERAIEYFRYPIFRGPHIAPEAATPLPVRDYNFIGYLS